MSGFSLFMLYAVTAIFAENLVLCSGIGASRLIRAARNPAGLLTYGALVAFFTVCAGALSYPVNLLIKQKSNALYIRPVIFVLCITVIYVAVILSGKRFCAKLYAKIQPHLTSCAFNGIVVGAPVIAALRGLNFVQSLGYCLGAALGFMFAAFLVSAGLKNAESDELPASFRGTPAALLYLGILSLAFAGLSGI